MLSPDTFVLPTRLDWFEHALCRYISQDLPSVGLVVISKPLLQHHVLTYQEHTLMILDVWPVAVDRITVQFRIIPKKRQHNIDAGALPEILWRWIGQLWPGAAIPWLPDIVKACYERNIRNDEVAELITRSGHASLYETKPDESKNAQIPELLFKLSWHQKAFEMYRQGYTYREIGEQIHQGQRTVQNYIGDIRKMRPDLTPRRQNPKRKQSQDT